MTREKVIKILTEYGHSPPVALDIALDYERKKPSAIFWVQMIMEGRR